MAIRTIQLVTGERVALDSFTYAYLECALWSSTDDAGEPIDDTYAFADLAYATVERAIDDCNLFQDANSEDIAQAPDGSNFNGIERAGHDFWLTRNHHGAGFWDGDYPKETGERLTVASHAFGELTLYVGDDGSLYFA